MSKFPKIQSVYKRDPKNNYKTFLEGQYSEPEFAALRNLEWEWTEKIDGTNIRVEYGWGSDQVFFKGRTDNAQIPGPLLGHLQKTFSVPLLKSVFCNNLNADDAGCPVILYGEGYGAGIQKGGGLYILDGVGFILFDVKVGSIWLKRASVKEIAAELSIQAVPFLGCGTLDQAIRVTKATLWSKIANRPAEGIVMRAPHGLLTRTGQRIITKVKAKDFETE